MRLLPTKDLRSACKGSAAMSKMPLEVAPRTPSVAPSKGDMATLGPNAPNLGLRAEFGQRWAELGRFGPMWAELGPV